MMLKALIVDQLESDGTLKSFRMERSEERQLIVAFADEYDEPREGPFHFHDEGDESRFRRGFANCRTRKLGSRYFFQRGGEWHVETSWQGIPTERSSVSYYALSLPKHAVPVRLSITDPRTPGRQFRRTVTRDDKRERYVIYLECSSSHGLFDFVLACDFVTDPAGFATSSFDDAWAMRGHNLGNLWEHWLPSEERAKVLEHFEAYTGGKSPEPVKLLLVPGYQPSFDRLEDSLRRSGRWSVKSMVQDDIDRASWWFQSHMSDKAARIVIFVDPYEGRPSNESPVRNQASEYLAFIQKVRDLGHALELKPIFVLYQHSRAEQVVQHGLPLSTLLQYNKFFKCYWDAGDADLERCLSQIWERVNSEWIHHPKSLEERVRVLFLASNPRTTAELQLASEVRRIEEEIKLAQASASIELISKWATTPDDLRRALLDVRPHIVHFSGHGEKDGSLLLEDERNDAVAVGRAALSEILRAAAPEVRLVVLNACFSQPSAEAVFSHVDCVIGMQQEIDDRSALKFSGAFYGAVGAGRSIQEAFEVACASIKLWNLPGSETPRISTRPGVHAARTFFVRK